MKTERTLQRRDFLLVSSDGAITAANRVLLPEFSAKPYETDTVKKMRVE